MKDMLALNEQPSPSDELLRFFPTPAHRKARA
jgi:hypothetical protein